MGVEMDGANVYFVYYLLPWLLSSVFLFSLPPCPKSFSDTNNGLPFMVIHGMCVKERCTVQCYLTHIVLHVS